MSDINRMLAQHFNQIKEHLETVIEKIKNDHYNAALDAALDQAKKVTKDQNSNWKEYWETEMADIRANEYCRIKAKAKSILERVDFLTDSLGMSVMFGGSNEQRETHDKMVDLREKMKDLVKYLEALCTLKTFHKSFCEIAETYGG